MITIVRTEDDYCYLTSKTSCSNLITMRSHATLSSMQGDESSHTYHLILGIIVNLIL